MTKWNIDFGEVGQAKDFSANSHCNHLKKKKKGNKLQLN